MRRDQLEHAIRTACQIIGAPEVIVVGSQSILGTYREEQLPRAATMSVEVDVLPIAESNEETARLADLIEGGSRGVLTLRTDPRLQYRRCRPGHFRAARRLARPARKGAERQHRRTIRGAAVHGLMPRQGRPLRRQAVRVAREGPELRRRAARRRPRRCRRHRGTAPHGCRAVPAGRPASNRVAGRASNDVTFRRRRRRRRHRRRPLITFIKAGRRGRTPAAAGAGGGWTRAARR